MSEGANITAGAGVEKRQTADSAAAAWAAGEFMITTARGDLPVAGWVKGPAALDFRVFAKDEEEGFKPGWVMTHLPTGYVLQKLACDRSKAMEIADSILALGDWDFSDPTACKPYSAGVSAIRKEIGNMNATALREVYSAVFSEAA